MAETTTLTLADFLLARIAEDEAMARAASAGGLWHYEDGDAVGAWTLYDESWAIAQLRTYRHEDYDYSQRLPAFRPPYYVDADANGAHIARWDPARVLAECEAKRRLVEETGSEDVDMGHEAGLCDGCDRARRAFALSAALPYLALAYIDHPDYNPAWRP